ncbi:MAG: hypothetical protein IPP66_21045 [Anaerolineales bacterium]|nr:hypothetical protein [Anaerolineales bacterium]
MPKWEYCAIGPIQQDEAAKWKGFYPQLIYFLKDGLKEQRISKEGNISERDILAKTIAELGENGWELISTGDSVITSSKGMHYLYFKRIKQST